MSLFYGKRQHWQIYHDQDRAELVITCLYAGVLRVRVNLPAGPPVSHGSCFRELLGHVDDDYDLLGGGKLGALNEATFFIDTFQLKLVAADVFSQSPTILAQEKLENIGIAIIDFDAGFDEDIVSGPGLYLDLIVFKDVKADLIDLFEVDRLMVNVGGVLCIRQSRGGCKSHG